jgi:phenylacetate-CoA ligase
MNVGLLARVLWKRSELRQRDRWSRFQIGRYQTGRLARLRALAYDRSPFYRRFHRGVEERPLNELPVLTKSQLMESFDELVTDRSVHLEDVRKHVERASANELFRGRYQVARTGGTTGNPGLFLADPSEWASIIASYNRAQEWAGIRPDLLKRLRLAVVSSRVPWHQSARVGASVDSPIVPVRRFDALQPLAEIVAGLNEWQPENVIAYASMTKILAVEALAGRLRIRPRAVMSSSEVLTEEARLRAMEAWGVAPFNVYAATETAAIASECQRHRLHLFEDLVITEVVDEQNRPVPRGTSGAKILVTVLFSRTQPLIRYEMSDRVSLSTEPCGCGLAYDLLETIEGRAEDILEMPAAAGGTVTIHPNLFHLVLEPLPIREWRIVQQANGVRVSLAGASNVDKQAVEGKLGRALEEAGALSPRVEIEELSEVGRTAVGKAPLIKRLPNNPTLWFLTGAALRDHPNRPSKTTHRERVGLRVARHDA